MKHVLHRLYWVWDYDKEENWLNEMSAKGLQLRNAGFCNYVFEEGTPGEYLYRLEFLKHWPRHPESMQYIRFVEDTGIEHVSSFKRWAYFRKKAADGPFDIFSDMDSRITHINRMLWFIAVLSLANVPNAILQIFHYFKYKTSVNLVLGLLILMLSGLLGYGTVRLWRKKQQLEREKMLRE